MTEDDIKRLEDRAAVGRSHHLDVLALATEVRRLQASLHHAERHLEASDAMIQDLREETGVNDAMLKERLELVAVIGNLKTHKQMVYLPVVTKFLLDRLHHLADATSCSSCGKHLSGTEAVPAPDPYVAEIHDDYTPVVLCDVCRQNHRDDV